MWVSGCSPALLVPMSLAHRLAALLVRLWHPSANECNRAQWAHALVSQSDRASDQMSVPWLDALAIECTPAQLVAESSVGRLDALSVRRLRRSVSGYNRVQLATVSVKVLAEMSVSRSVLRLAEWAHALVDRLARQLAMLASESVTTCRCRLRIIVWRQHSRLRQYTIAQT